MDKKQYKEMSQMLLNAADTLWAVKEGKLTDKDELIRLNQEIYDYLREHGYPEDVVI
jgi:hypothetical protein